MKKSVHNQTNIVSDYQIETPQTQGEKIESDEAAASLVEYALLVALIAIVCILAVTFLGQTTSNSLSSSDLTNALS